jgi:hypothetical protein
MSMVELHCDVREEQKLIAKFMDYLVKAHNQQGKAAYNEHNPHTI